MLLLHASPVYLSAWISFALHISYVQVLLYIDTMRLQQHLSLCLTLRHAGRHNLHTCPTCSCGSGRAVRTVYAGLETLGFDRQLVWVKL